MIEENDYATTTTTSRSLTFLVTDENGQEYDNETISDLGLLIVFSVLSAIYFLVMLIVIRISSKCQAFYEWNALRLLLPAVAAFLCLETATLAVQASGTIVVSHPWAIAVFMVSSTIAPIIFLCSFVITFLAYRTRSMPFCCVYRGPGRQVTTEPWRDDDEEVLQPLVRPAVLVVAFRLFALGLLILNLIVNFDVVWTEENLAGRTGWATVVMDPTIPDLNHVILALVPMALVSLLCLYFSLLLWRYGCELSLIIYSSGVINPWLTPVFGSFAMLAGQMFGPDLYLITSNSGILMYILSLVRILFEARKDLEASGDLGHFLDALGNDNITRTQKGLEKYALGDEDTLSSGQHQQWMLNESNNELSMTSKQDIEAPATTKRPVQIPSKRDSYNSQHQEPSSSSARRKNSGVKKSNLKAPTPMQDEPLEELQEDRSSHEPAPSSLLQSTTPPSVLGESDTRTSVNPDAVHGITTRPESLRRGQRPKGRYVVH